MPVFSKDEKDRISEINVTIWNPKMVVPFCIPKSSIYSWDFPLSTMHFGAIPLGKPHFGIPIPEIRDLAGGGSGASSIRWNLLENPYDFPIQRPHAQILRGVAWIFHQLIHGFSWIFHCHLEKTDGMSMYAPTPDGLWHASGQSPFRMAWQWKEWEAKMRSKTLEQELFRPWNDFIIQ